MQDSYDVVVVGGGTAGLSGALTLARARRKVLVVDAGQPRNAPAEQVHGYLGREGTPRAELAAIGREEVRTYGGEVVNGTVTSARRGDDGTFTVQLADGTGVHARRLLVTTGLVDELPAIPGLTERWGTAVLHCPYCHGWEVRDQAIGVIAGETATALHAALLWRQWSSDVALFLHTADAPDVEQRALLDARGITVVTGEVAAVQDDATVRLVSGVVVDRDALVVRTGMVARSDLLAQLGGEPAEQRFNDVVLGTAVPAEPTGATSVPGVYVAGNVTNIVANVIVAAAGGMNVTSMLNADLVAADGRLALTGRLV